MLLLAERLRESHGGELDDDAILAVSEATGAPVDYVRIAVARRAETEKQTVTKKLRSTYLSLDPEERAWVLSAGTGAASGMMYALNARFYSNGLFGIFMILLFVLGLFVVGTSKTSRIATIAGAILGGVAFIGASLFGLLFGAYMRVDPVAFIPFTVLAAVCGNVAHRLLVKNKSSLGLKDPLAERQELLRQLVDLQDRLKTGEQSMTFLSVDIVGSTRLKQHADALNVEFTFNEYHGFVEMVTQKYGGHVHSTAGDGVTCVFDHPQQAFAAARNLQVGIIELNTFRNRLGKPLVLRCGIHTGAVVAPDAKDKTSVNFAHVIDMAAHMQKAAPEGGIAVSQESAIHIPGGPKSVGEEKTQVDGMTAYIWRSRRSGQSLPPPMVPSRPPDS